jgi:hypothetical protein
VSASVLGLAAARIWGLAPGATIVLLTTAAFAVSARVRRAAAARASAALRGDA